MIISSYPTGRIDSTVHPMYGTTLDLSNISMLMLYAKLGLHLASLRQHGALHLNASPRRINRQFVPTGQQVLEKIPVELWDYWKGIVHGLINTSESKIALLVGAAGVSSYVTYLEDNNVHHREIWPSGNNKVSYNCTNCM
jgi:hypothetical protein